MRITFYVEGLELEPDEAIDIPLRTPGKVNYPMIRADRFEVRNGKRADATHGIYLDHDGNEVMEFHGRLGVFGNDLTIVLQARDLAKERAARDSVNAFMDAVRT